MENMNIMKDPLESEDDILQEIQELETKLASAKAKLQSKSVLEAVIPNGHDTVLSNLSPQILHLWLLLADSALPIGSFAFSSGLESYIAHRPLRPSPSSSSLPQPPKPTPRTELSRFLRLSLLSVSTTTIPFITAAFQNPTSTPLLDDIFDAGTTCEVARRASVSQGRALCSVWDKSFGQSLLFRGLNVPKDDGENEGVLGEGIDITHRPDHFGVAWGYITRLSGLSPTEEHLHQVLFVFLFNHVKAVLSSAVRQSLIGPYVAQQILASEETRKMVMDAVERGRKINVDDAGQCVPTLDLWQGRHEKLYTRIFNS